MLLPLAEIFGHVEAGSENNTVLVNGYFLPSLQFHLCGGGGFVNMISEVPSSFRASKLNIPVFCAHLFITLAHLTSHPQLALLGKT